MVFVNCLEEYKLHLSAWQAQDVYLVICTVCSRCSQEHIIDVLIYLSTAIGFSPGGSNTVHIYTQTIHRMTQNKQYTERHNNLGECGPCPVSASYTLAFALQLRKKHRKTSVRGAASKNTQTTIRISVSKFGILGLICCAYFLNRVQFLVL